MPYPSRMDLRALVDTARGMVAEAGADGLSLGALARRLGVRPPSLYRYIRGRDDLIRAVNTSTTEALFQAIGEGLAVAPPEAGERMLAVARAYRVFARANPNTYVLAMADPAPTRQPDPDYLVRLVLPLQAAMAELCGADRSLTALRSLLALAHGFVMLELGGQLRRGGDLDVAYEDSVRALLEGWARLAEGRAHPPVP